MGQKIKIDADLAVRMLSANEAVELLSVYTESKKKRLHTMERTGFGLMGCAMDLAEIKKRLKLCNEGEIFISDTVGGHGVVFKDHVRNNFLFLETDNTKWKAIKEKRFIK